MRDRARKTFYSIIPGRPTGTAVVEGDLQGAIRSWKKGLKDSGILQDVYNRREYQKPSDVRRRTRQRAVYGQKKQSMES
jgi:ribosomal protein S21